MLHLIAILDQAGGIGRDNDLLCHLPADLKHFKGKTMGHVMIMGRKTFESLPGILPGRPHYVITRQKDYNPGNSQVTVFNSIEAVEAKLQGNEDYFVVGGASLYKLFISKADSLYITRIAATFPADTFFPAIDKHIWYAAEMQEGLPDEKNAYAYRFLRYMRR